MAQQLVLTDQLRESLASRSVIDQALGVIMGEERCTAYEAFNILRAVSQNRNIKIRQVAEDVITRVTGRLSRRRSTLPANRVGLGARWRRMRRCTMSSLVQLCWALHRSRDVATTPFASSGSELWIPDTVSSAPQARA